MKAGFFARLKRRDISGQDIRKAIRQTFLHSHLDRAFHNCLLKMKIDISEQHFISYAASLTEETLLEFAEFAAQGSQDATAFLCKGFGYFSNLKEADPIVTERYQNAIRYVCKNSVDLKDARIPILLLKYDALHGNVQSGELLTLLTTLKRISASNTIESVHASSTLALLYLGGIQELRLRSLAEPFTLNWQFDQHIFRLKEQEDKILIAKEYAKVGTAHAIRYLTNAMNVGTCPLRDNWKNESDLYLKDAAQEAKFFLEQSILQSFRYNVLAFGYESNDEFFRTAFDRYKLLPDDTNADLIKFKQTLVAALKSSAESGCAHATLQLYRFYHNGCQHLDLEHDETEAQYWLARTANLKSIPLSGKALSIMHKLENDEVSVDLTVRHLAATYGHTQSALFLAKAALMQRDRSSIDKWLTQAYSNSRLENVYIGKSILEIIKLAQSAHLFQDVDFAFFLKWHAMAGSQGELSSLDFIRTHYILYLRSHYRHDPESLKRYLYQFDQLMQKIKCWRLTTDYLPQLLNITTEMNKNELIPNRRLTI